MRAGEPIEAREATASLVFIEGGWACRFEIARNGQQQISAVLVPGDICNIDTLMCNRLDRDIHMLSTGTVLSVPRDKVQALTAEYPGIARSFAWFSFLENAILARWTFCLGRLSARKRLAHLFCELAVRRGNADNTGSINFDLPLTQECIGDVLGLTPVHVNRTLRQLRTERLLVWRGGKVSIPDVAALRHAAEFGVDYLHLGGPLDLPSSVQ